MVHGATMPLVNVGAVPDRSFSVTPRVVLVITDVGATRRVDRSVRTTPFDSVTVSPAVPPLSANVAVAPVALVVLVPLMLSDPNVTAPDVVVLLLRTVSVR